jgi:hypothetical protein
MKKTRTTQRFFSTPTAIEQMSPTLLGIEQKFTPTACPTMTPDAHHTATANQKPLGDSPASRRCPIFHPCQIKAVIVYPDAEGLQSEQRPRVAI